MTNGENIIYHYIQKTLLSEEDPDHFTQELIERLIIDLSIWFPPEVYRQIPILLPFVIRDNSCRKKNNETEKDEWGHANEKGFLRDDNSLIKGIIKSFSVDGNRVKEYNNKKLANGFVASHIWRNLNKQTCLASTYEKTNSFIPNLVWLPKQISKLTDREGSFAQNLLKTISYNIYYKNNKNIGSEFKNNVWGELNNPQLETITSYSISDLNYFRVPQKWIDKKKAGLVAEFDKINDVLLTGSVSEKKVKCSSYLPSLKKNISPQNIQKLIDWLGENIEELNSNC